MSITPIQKIFAYNTGSLISGTTQVGDIAISEADVEYSANFGGLQWWGGPNQELGYVIAYPVPTGDHPTPIGGLTSYVGFLGTKNMTNPFFESTFLELVNSRFNQNFTSGNDASTWLTSNGYWNSWVFITPTPTPTINVTPTPTPTVTTTSTPTATNTPSPTSSGVVEVLVNPIIVGLDEYIQVGVNEYLMFIDPEPVPTPTPTPTSTETPTPTPTNTETPSLTNTPTNSSTPTPEPTTTPTQTVTPTNTPVSSETPTPTVTETPTNTPVSSETPTPTVTETPTNTETPTPTVTETPTNTPASSETPTPTVTETPTNTPTNTETPTPTVTETPTNTPTLTQTPTQTSAPACDVVVTIIGPTPTPTASVAATPTPTPTPVWSLAIINSNTTRSVTSVTVSGVTQSLTLGSYPVVNSSNGYSSSISSCSGSGVDALQINFGGTGFCGLNSKILKNGVDTGLPLANYAAATFNCGGLAISTSDKITIIID